MLKEFSLPWLVYLRKKLRESSTHITATNIDWSSGTSFYKSITASTEFTFSNLIEGKSVNVVIRNSNAVNVEVYFPVLVHFDSAVSRVIQPSHETFFTFTLIDGVVHGTSLNNMTNV